MVERVHTPSGDAFSTWLPSCWFGLAILRAEAVPGFDHRNCRLSYWRMKYYSIAYSFLGFRDSSETVQNAVIVEMLFLPRLGESSSVQGSRAEFSDIVRRHPSLGALLADEVAR
jgi:hypothetical protein